MKRLGLVIVAIAALTGPAIAKTDDAPEADSAAQPKSMAPPLDVQWSNNLPWRPLIAWRSLETSAPVLADDTLYVGSSRGRAVFAVDVQRGTTRWRRTTPGQVESTVAVGDGRVYAGDSKGWLTAFDVNDGRVIWQENLGGVVQGDVLFSDGVLYLLTADNRLHARDAGTGEERWVYSHEPPSGITIYGTSSPALADGHVIAGFSDGSVVAVRQADGGAAWSRTLVREGRFRDIDSAPTVYDGRVYVSSYDGQLYCLDASNGVELWSEEPGGTTRVAVSGDVLVHGTDEGEVIARRVADGRVLWRHKFRRGLPNTPVIDDGRVWVATSNGPIRALDLENGSLVWGFKPFLRVSGFDTPVLVGSRRLYAYSNAGTLFSFAQASDRALPFTSGWDRHTQDEE